jgi:hypothetical protein
MNYTTRRTSAQWQSLVDAQNTSGLSAPQFCKERGVSYASFSKWRNRLSKPNNTDTSHQPAFVELSKQAVTRPEDKPTPWLVELELGSGLYLRIAKS